MKKKNRKFQKRGVNVLNNLSLFQKNDGKFSRKKCPLSSKNAPVIDYKNVSLLKKYMSDQIDFARNNGYVETIMGRRRYLQNINSQNNMLRSGAERNAINAPVQGSAADIIKIAMININSEFKKQSLKSKMLLQVHDELVFDVHNSEKDMIQDIVKTTMESAVKLKVPLKIDLEFGKNWLEAH